MVSAPGRAVAGPSPLAKVGASAIAGVKVRRFEMGASGEGWDRFLVDRGYKIASCGSGAFRVYGPSGKRLRNNAGKAHFSVRDLSALLDRERKAAGLEPICVVRSAK